MVIGGILSSTALTLLVLPLLYRLVHGRDASMGRNADGDNETGGPSPREQLAGA